MTHPTANITGFISLKMHPYVTVQDYCAVTCPKTKLKALLKYNDEVYSTERRLSILELARQAKIPNRGSHLQIRS